MRFVFQTVMPVLKKYAASVQTPHDNRSALATTGQSFFVTTQSLTAPWISESNHETLTDVANELETETNRRVYF